jgi:hypothetical protein
VTIPCLKPLERCESCASGVVGRGLSVWFIRVLCTSVGVGTGGISGVYVRGSLCVGRAVLSWVYGWTVWEGRRWCINVCGNINGRMVLSEDALAVGVCAWESRLW